MKVVEKLLAAGAAVFAALMFVAPEVSAQLVLAADGTSEYQVVVPDEAASPGIGADLGRAARLVQAAFQASGFAVPVVTESGRAPGKPGIYLGDTAFARAAGVDLAGLRGWSYVHRAIGRDIVVAGNDRPSTVREETVRQIDRIDLDRTATVKAAADFLREYAGARFLYPDLGLYLADGDRVNLLDTPAVEFLPTPRIAVPADLDRRKEVQLEYNIWRSRNSFYHIANNYSPLFNTLMNTHTYGPAVPPDEYFDGHPEYFAQLGGRRVRGVQYCVSNPGFQELVYRYLAGAFDRGYDKVYLGQSDGFQPCQCDVCRDLYGTGDDWTEKLWIFNRNMAQRLYESHPGKTVALVAYTVTERAAPKSFSVFPPNTMLQMCGTNEDDLAKWAGIDIPMGIDAYIYNWTPNQTSRYTPMVTPLSIEAQVKRLYRYNIRGLYRDGGGPYLYGLEGVAAYVMGRLWDDPENNRAADLATEFVEAAFGPAAAPMRRFYDQLHHGIELYANYLGTRLPAWTYTPIAGRGRKHVTDFYQMTTLLFPPALLENLERELAAAERLEASERVKARLALVRREFDWLRRTANVVHLTNAYQVAPESVALRDRLLDTIDARNALIASFYDERGGVKSHPAWNGILFPPPGHDASHLRLAHNGYQMTVADTSLNWDTAALRAAPPPPER